MELERIYQALQRVESFDERLHDLTDSVRKALREVVKIEEKVKDMTATGRQEVVNKEADSLTIGTPTNGQFKVYDDLNDPEAVKRKIENALACLDHAEKGKEQADKSRPASAKGDSSV
nr:hypothetical protein 4 [bacterium]